MAKGNKPTAAQRRKSWTCPNCGRVFATRQGGRAHLASCQAVKGPRQPAPPPRAKRHAGTTTLLDPIEEPATLGRRLGRAGFRSTPGGMNAPRLGDTLAGQDWSELALNPNNSSFGGAAPIPDTAQPQSATMQLRNIVTVAKPASMPADQPWGFRVVIPPVPELPGVIKYRNAAGDELPGPWRALYETPGVFETPGQFQLGWTDSDVDPAVTVEPAPLIVPGPIRMTTQYRITARGATIVQNANSLRDQGVIYAGQYAAKPGVSPQRPSLNGYAGTNQQTVEHCNFGGIVDSPDALVREVPTTYVSEARKGLYIPMRFDNPAHQYTESAAAEWAGAGVADVKTGQVVTIATSATETRESMDEYVQAFGAPVNAAATTAGAINMQVGVIIAEGLDPLATYTIKIQSGYEVIPVATDPAAAFVKDAPPADKVAIDLTHEVQRHMPMAFPHKYNSLGAIMGVIGKIAAQVLPHVAPWLIGKVSSWLGGAKPTTPAPRRMVELEVD